jgi:uncharacterized glyoxalase superfamily protein PhnB
MMPVPYAPEGWPTVVPRIFAEQTSGLVEFIKEVFHAEGEYDGSRPAELHLGNSIIMVGDTAARGHVPQFLYVYVPDADAAYERAMARGARSLEAPLDTAYGDRRCMVEDAWGNTWQIATRRRD